MKALVVFAVLALGVSAHANTFTIKNEEAMRLVEATLGMVSEWTPVDANTKTENIMGPIQCRYSKNADGIVTDAHCYYGFSPTGTTGAEVPHDSLAIFQGIRQYAKDTVIIGYTAISVDRITCTMKITPRKYTCVITVN